MRESCSDVDARQFNIKLKVLSSCPRPSEERHLPSRPSPPRFSFSMS